MRVISTTALLLAEVSVSSEYESMSSLIFISGRGLARGGLADLGDLVAEPGGVFVALGFDRLVEFGFELGQALVQGFPGENPLRNFAGVRVALVHRLEHWLEQTGEVVV